MDSTARKLNPAATPPQNKTNPSLKLSPTVDAGSLANTKPIAAVGVSAEAVTRVLDLARWAPSGDNTQPWRFEIVANNHVVIHGHDTSDHCIYDLQGHASQIALGALLETISIAAPTQNLSVQFERRRDMPDNQPTFDATFEQSDRAPDPLASFIEQRVTQRRRMSTKPIIQTQIESLDKSLPKGFTVHLYQGIANRMRFARLLYRSAHIRLTTEEAYHTHRNVIQWRAKTSKDRIPDQAVGLDPLTTRLMQWAMQSWSRVKFLNRFFAGTVAPRIQLDFVPGLCCGAHFVLTADKPAESQDDFVAAGRALQRFWLTATELGLQFQPELTPLIFSQYVRDNIAFTRSPRAIKRAQSIAKQLEQLIGTDHQGNAVFMGRIGKGRIPKSRSIRQPLTLLTFSCDERNPSESQ